MDIPEGEGIEKETEEILYYWLSISKITDRHKTTDPGYSKNSKLDK